MAQAMTTNSKSDLKSLTDCMYFINGNCKSNETCRYRHCREAVEQIKNCPKWPKRCRNIACPYRHPALAPKVVLKKELQITGPLLVHPSQSQPQALSTLPQKSFISFFWDIENVPIPRGQKPFDIVQRIRQKLVVESGLQEADFSCYCNINMIPLENQQSLQHAAVRIVHVPDRKPGAVDRQIMLELGRFGRIHRPPATIVLISGDIDFVGQLSDLRHQAGFHVIVIHNKPAKEELKATVHAHYPWELFTLPRQQQPVNITNSLDLATNERSTRTVQPNRMRHSSSSRSLRRRDPSPCRPFPFNKQQIPVNYDIKKYQCPKCPIEFESSQSLRQHQNAQKHLFNCPICDDDFFTTTSQIQHQNAKIHLLYCPVCNDSFFTKQSQSQHQKDKNHYVLAHKCNQCNRHFSKIESLNQHQQATGHTSAILPPLNPNESIRQQLKSSSLPLNDQGNNTSYEDPMMIILQGIDAIKEHFSKQRSKK